MSIINVKENDKYLAEYCRLCSLEWGEPKTKKEMNNFVRKKKEEVLKGDKVISVLGLVDDNILMGFISLFKYDSDKRKDLTPWYATMYVKSEYRGKGFSKLLNDAILDEAKKLGYDRVYLKTDLVDYYEKYGAKYIEDLESGEKLYYIDCTTKKSAKMPSY
ncbi:MAG: GNAT family N-acetyltransferase [Candidatus Saccharibacteria bacterium]|nr:GNAT family N-acetyltransferase [Candidatus Saccharibacteria bacterium]